MLYVLALIQLIACAEAKRDMCYFTFGDAKLRDSLVDVHKYLTDKHLQVCKFHNY